MSFPSMLKVGRFVNSLFTFQKIAAGDDMEMQISAMDLRNVIISKGRAPTPLPSKKDPVSFLYSRKNWE